jgi:hypothetical protein
MSPLFRGGNTVLRRVAPGLGAGRFGRRHVGPTLDVVVKDAGQPSQDRVRGASLGLPAEGPGSLATFSSRVGAFFVDAIGAALIAALVTAPELPGNWSLLPFGVLYVLTLVRFGQTPGMRLLGLRLAHPRPEERLALWRAVVRTALLMLLVPALVVDADGRGLHDRLTDTAVVRER